MQKTTTRADRQAASVLKVYERVHGGTSSEERERVKRIAREAFNGSRLARLALLASIYGLETDYSVEFARTALQSTGLRKFPGTEV